MGRASRLRHPLFCITDDLGSIIGTFNTSGTKARDYTYDPIGRALTATGSGVTINYRLAAGYYLSDINTYKFGTRYYDPNNSGTWTQPDPAGQGNPYTYAGGNPTNNTDPSGCSIFHSIAKAVSGVATIVGAFATDASVASAGAAAVACGAALVGVGVSALDTVGSCSSAGGPGECRSAGASLVFNSAGAVVSGSSPLLGTVLRFASFLP